MRKRVFLAVLMTVVLALGTGCTSTTNSASTADQTVVIEVAGTSYTKAQVSNATQNVLSYMSYMYSLYGMSYDTTDATTIATAQTQAIQWMIENAVVSQQIKDQGMDVFTDAELADIQKAADETYQGYVDTIKQSYFSDSTLTGDDLTKAITDKMTELGYPDEASVLSDQKNSKAQEKLKAAVVKDVTVTDADIQTEYDTKLEAAKTSYTDNLSQYATDVAGGSIIYYRPAGYRYVKNLLVKFTDEDTKAISDIQDQITAKQDDLDTNSSMIAAIPTDETGNTDDMVQRRAKLNDAKTQLDADIAGLNTQLQTAKDKGYADIQTTVDEISAKLAAGEDFDALMATYGQDTGMQSDPAKTEGYLVCTGDTQYVTEFTDAAMALAKVGDVSAPFHTQYGTHFVKYVSDLAEGAVPLADIKDKISASLLTTKQDDLYTTTVNQWVTDANAKVYTDRLSN